MPGKDSRSGERVPASLRIRLKYTDESQFVQKYGANISRGGIFIATRTPKPVGITLRFEFQLADGEPLIRGEGEVVWVKPFDAAQPTKAHGMGVRFTYLAPESRAVIDRALAWKESRRHAEATTVAHVEPPAQEEEKEAGSIPTEDTRRVNLAAVLAGGRAAEEAAGNGAEPTPAEELFGPAAGREVARPITIELEADEPDDEQPQAQPTQAAKPLARDDDDDDESGEITIEPASEGAEAEAEAETAHPAPSHAEVAQLAVTEEAPPAPRTIAAPARARLAGLDAALAVLAALPPVAPGEHGDADGLDALAADLGLTDEQLAAEIARARARVASLVEKLSGGEGEFDWLREPPRPEPLPSPSQARTIVQRMLGHRRES